MTTGRLPSVEGGIQPTIVDAKGDLIVATAADTVSRIAVGANDTVLTADSSTATGLKWAAAAGGGKVLQVVQATYSTAFTTTSTSYSDTGLSLAITPSSVNSKVLVMINQTLRATGSSDTSVGAALRILRGATTIYEPAPNRYQMHYVEFSQANSPALDNLASMVYLDSPATTSATTYKTQLATYQSGESSSTSAGSSISVITLFEIGA